MNKSNFIPVGGETMPTQECEVAFKTISGKKTQKGTYLPQDSFGRKSLFKTSNGSMFGSEYVESFAFLN